MSKSILYARDIETDKINGTSGQVIDPDVNVVGQVLRITSLDPKAVAFEDIPSGVPDAAGFPDGYVLKIVDNTTNTVNWEPDIGGGAAIPFILTGDSVNALKVQTTTLEPMIRIDTVDKEVHLSGIRNMVEGSDDEKKFSVFNSADSINPVFNVDTLNTKVEVNNGLTKKGEIVLLNAPETLIPGVNSSLNMKLQFDASGSGDTNFVGYVAKNGSSAMYSLVNNATAGLYFLTDTSAGIQTTAQELNISSPNPIGKLTAQFNQEISLEANGCELNVGEGNLISADSKVVIKGTDDSEKFVVKDNLGNNIFQVATNGDSVFIGGNQNSGAKLSIFDPFFNLIFLVDTNNNSLVMGNSAVTASEIYLKPTNGLIDLVGSGNAILQSTIRASHNTNPTGGSVQMSAFRDNTDYNKIESTGAQGLLIKADTDLRLESDYGATMTAIGCSIIGENGFVNLLAQEPVGGINTNLRLQNDGILILTEDLGPPQNQMQFTYNSIISKGNPNTNTASINFQPNANTISMSDTSMNNISINNSPTLAQHGTRKDYVDGKFNNTTLTGSANVPTGSSLSIVDAPTLSTHATNKQYVDTKFTSPRTILSALTYVNELAGGGTLPSTPTTTNTTTFSEFNFTGATLITSVNGFTLVSAGVFQYTGADTRVFNFNIDIGVVTAVADQLVQVVLLNGSNVVIQPTLSQFYTSTTDKNGGSSVNLTLSLSTNDIVKVGIRTPRQTTSLTIENYKLQIIEN